MKKFLSSFLLISFCATAYAADFEKAYPIIMDSERQADDISQSEIDALFEKVKLQSVEDKKSPRLCSAKPKKLGSQYQVTYGISYGQTDIILQLDPCEQDSSWAQARLYVAQGIITQKNRPELIIKDTIHVIDNMFLLDDKKHNCRVLVRLGSAESGQVRNPDTQAEPKAFARLYSHPFDANKSTCKGFAANGYLDKF